MLDVKPGKTVPHSCVDPSEVPRKLPTLLGHARGHCGPRPVEGGAKICRAAASQRVSQKPCRTTLMLRNLPADYTRDDLLALLTVHGFARSFDFLYLPIDFTTHGALGYAFVNLVTQADAERLSQSLDGFSSWTVPSSKVCRVSWSQPLQGFEAHVARYRNSPLMHESVPDGYRPMLFCSGERVPFPAPTKRIKPPRKGAQRMLV